MNRRTRKLDSRTIRRGRVLVVDSRARLGRRLAEALIEHDFVAVASGADALAVISAGRPFDLILCALVLKDMSGLDVLFHLCRENPDQAEWLVFTTHAAAPPRPHVLDGVSNLCIELPRDLDQPSHLDDLRTLIERSAGRPGLSRGALP
jgi:two-component system, NtrC family, sensor kinase